MKVKLIHKTGVVFNNKTDFSYSKYMFQMSEKQCFASVFWAMREIFFKKRQTPKSENNFKFFKV